MDSQNTGTKMVIRCFGPRGSLPTPARRDFSTIKYGGNTNCYYVEAGPFRLILDCGSGMAILGDFLMKLGLIGRHFINLLTHYHWDHIQGLPFCVPYFIGSNTFHIHGPVPSGHEATGQPRTAVEAELAMQQSSPHFPIAHECMPARKTYTGHDRQFSKVVVYQCGTVLVDGKEKEIYTQVDPSTYKADNPNFLKITTIPLNHPDGCLGYRIDYMGQSMAYCTDNEPFRKPNFQISRLAAGVQWLLLDGQYTEEEIGGMNQTFGHGTPESCIDQAVACKAGLLVVHHHDIRRNDDALDKMETEARAYAEATGLGVACVQFAKEGMTWEITDTGMLSWT
jgi:phosphoribosyl 1,2-cyclic phosphodiesterase